MWSTLCNWQGRLYVYGAGIWACVSPLLIKCGILDIQRALLFLNYPIKSIYAHILNVLWKCSNADIFAKLYILCLCACGWKYLSYDYFCIHLCIDVCVLYFFLFLVFLCFYPLHICAMYSGYCGMNGFAYLCIYIVWRFYAGTDSYVRTRG